MGQALYNEHNTYNNLVNIVFVWMECLYGMSNTFLPSPNIKAKVSSIKNSSITTSTYTPFIYLLTEQGGGG